MSDITGSNKIIRCRNRRTKSDKHKAERKLLLEEIERMIGLDENNRGVSLNKLKENEELKNFLKVEIDKIKRIFKCGTWAYFKKREDRDEIGLLRSMFKSDKYEIISKRQYEYVGDEMRKYTCLYFIKDFDMNKLLKIKR